MSKHLKIEERIKIQTLLEIGKTIDEIAKYVGRHRSTIYREMSRSGVRDQQYCAELYHNQARSNMSRIIDKTPPDEIIELINKKILEEQWSPEQISNWLKKQAGEHVVSHVWIYDYIKKDKVQGGELHNHMRRGGNYNKEPKEYKGKIPNRVSIEERPDIVNKRERLGDLEIDLIIGSKKKGAILTIVDRTSRQCKLRKLKDKTAQEVFETVVSAVGSNVHTITSDNGTEFTYHEKMASELNIEYFFAHPYASYERGSIENLNGLVRQYIPKGTDFDGINQVMLDEMENKLNNRPRKVLDFLTPSEYTSNHYNAA